jgi:hypothetical protein
MYYAGGDKVKFEQYILTEDIDKIFIRLGSMSGQYQTHKGQKQAPAKKGIWMLPIQASKNDLGFLGGYGEINRLGIKPKDFEKEYGISKEEYDKLKGSDMEKLNNIVNNRKIKEHYKSIKLKNTDYVWTHMGKGPPNIGTAAWPWYKVSVNEYWKLFKKTFGNELKNRQNFDGEWAEVFWETT